MLVTQAVHLSAQEQIANSDFLRCKKGTSLWHHELVLASAIFCRLVAETCWSFIL